MPYNVPFGVLFHKAADVLSDGSWRVLYSWYNDIYVSVRWNCSLGNPINVKKEPDRVVYHRLYFLIFLARYGT